MPNRGDPGRPPRRPGARAVAAILLAAAVPRSGQAQAGPGFDCARASTRIEHRLCQDGDPELPWLDRTLQRLYDAARTRPNTKAAALAAGQRAWLDTRDACRGSEDALTECLRAAYWRRIRVLAAPTDPARLTGTYRDPAIHGRLSAVRLPSGAVALDLDSDTGPPAFNGCSLSAILVPRNGRLTYDAAAAGDPGDAGCTVAITPAPDRFAVSSERCPALCGAGATLDGTYARRDP